MGRVLIADDEAALLDVLARAVEEVGHEVVRALDGDAAWAHAVACRPDLILADVMMPGRTGVDLLHAVRADAGLSGTPVVLMGVVPRDHVSEPCYFVEKPIDLDQLRRTLVDALSSARQAPARTADPASASRRDLLLRWLTREIDERLTSARLSAGIVARQQRGVDSDHSHLLLAQLSRLSVLVESLSAAVDYARPSAAPQAPPAPASGVPRPRARALA